MSWQPKLVVPLCEDEVMSSTTAVTPAERLEVLFEELSELAGQRNAIDGRIVEIVAEMDRDELCGSTGARSVTALVALCLVQRSNPFSSRLFSGRPDMSRRWAATVSSGP